MLNHVDTLGLKQVAGEGEELIVHIRQPCSSSLLRKSHQLSAEGIMR